ncbi:MAG: exo-alpha-sialidase [Chloroflexi bacterium]|nr:exo-alpha-sialidase [Chloroflexota bacterium]
MIHVRDRVDVTIYRDPGAYLAHPCVAQLSNGDLLVAFNESLPRHPWMHPPSDPRYINLMARSRDGGQTWITPRVVPSYDMTGVECPSVAQLSTGQVMLVQWRFAWYPLETAHKLWQQPNNGLDLHLIEQRGWRGKRPVSEADWDESPYPWARGDSGVFISLSGDGGLTWDSTVKAATAPYRRGYSPRPPTELADGTILLALDSHDERGILYVLRSTDHGRTWESPPTRVSDDRPLGEPTILALPSGKVIIHSRSSTTGLIHQHVSLDGGYTWGAPALTTIWGYPAHLLRLSDGRLLTIYGVRRPPYGIRACLSDNDGESWDTDHELIVRDGMRSSNLGYPTAARLADGRIFTAYYGDDDDGVTYIMGSSFSLP